MLTTSKEEHFDVKELEAGKKELIVNSIICEERDTLKLPVKSNGVDVNILLDSGAKPNCIQDIWLLKLKNWKLDHNKTKLRSIWTASEAFGSIFRLQTKLKD